MTFIAQWQVDTTNKQQAFDDEETALRFAKTAVVFDRKIVVFEVEDGVL